MEKRKIRVFYYGRVQGVGFRYAAGHIAASYPVGGWVRNLPDGSVEVVVEGRPEDIDSFLSELERTMERYIHRKKSAGENPSGEMKDFTVRF